MPGIVLHQPDGSYSEAAQAILTDAAALPIGFTQRRRDAAAIHHISSELG